VELFLAATLKSRQALQAAHPTLNGKVPIFESDSFMEFRFVSS
jgi:hypothetical protein